MDPEEFAADLESLDISACKEKILQLQAERERRREYTERLQEKLKALNNEHAARKEEAARCKQELTEAQQENKKKQQSLREAEERHGGSGGNQLAVIGGGMLANEASKDRAKEKVRHFMEELLQAHVQTDVRKNDLGIRTFDETELMVEKPAKDQDKEATSVDSVLITYNVPNSELRYNLSYRVDRHTTAKMLREDACHYWGLSEVEFILKTMENAKVHDKLDMANCFRKHEEAHLVLAQKTPRCIQAMDTEMNAIRPKTGKNSRKAKKAATDPSATTSKGPMTEGQFYFQMLTSMPGLYDFMIQRDQRVVGHLPRIKLRNCCVYACLVCLNFACLMLARPQSSYTVREGVVQAMTRQYWDDDRGALPKFMDLRSKDELWDWLTYTVPKELFVNTSDLRTYNYLPGYVQVRVQQVKPAERSNCALRGERLSVVAPDTKCWAETYTAETALREDLNVVELYWSGCNATNYTISVCENLTEQNTTAYPVPGWTEDHPNPLTKYPGVAGKSGRGSERKPWKFSVGRGLFETAGGTSLAAEGDWDEFSTGYAAEYSLQSENLTDTYDAFVADMKFLASVDWIGPRTRHVQLGFATYNHNYNAWISNWFVVDMFPNSAVTPRLQVDSFKSTRPMSMDGLEFFALDLVRSAFVLYILTYNLAWEFAYERQPKPKGSGSGLNYIFTLYFWADMGIGVCGVYIILMRYIFLGEMMFTPLDFLRELRTDYFSTKSIAQVFQNIATVEAGFLAFSMFRFVMSLRVNRHVYIILSTVARALSRAVMFFLAIVPLLIGCVAVSHALWNDTYDQHRTIAGSFIDTVLYCYGLVEEDGTRLQDRRSGSSLVLHSALFFLAQILGLNSWTAILVETYQKRRVAAGYWPSMYKWKEYTYINWSLWTLPRMAYLKAMEKLGRHIERPKEDVDG